MNPADKKSLRKEEVRSLILHAAKKLFVGEGFHATSMRKIASSIGYSPTTLYLYYTDKNDILYALSQEGFAILRAQMAAIVHVESPFERLKALGRIYLLFAREHPDYYDVMFMLKEPMEFLDQASDDRWLEGKEVFSLLLDTVIACQQQGYFADDPPEHIALQGWALVHGLSSLYLTSRIQKIRQEIHADAAIEEIVESAFKAYTHLLATKQGQNNNTVNK